MNLIKDIAKLRKEAKLYLSKFTNLKFLLQAESPKNTTIKPNLRLDKTTNKKNIEKYIKKKEVSKSDVVKRSVLNYILKKFNFFLGI